MTARIEAIRALVEAEIASTIESRVRAARGDVRCLDCNLRYDERQEYRCHVDGGGHDYDEGDLAGAEEIERSNPVEYVTLSVDDLLAALAPIAPDAEPVEWEWSAGDVVLDADGIAWQRDGKRIHYPWLAVGQAVQRDQDITDLVTNRGGRVLVCKARGIGVEHTEPCFCGSRDAYSLTPGEWIDHQPNACRFMRATDPSLAPGVEAPAEQEPGTPLAGLASAREADDAEDTP